MYVRNQNEGLGIEQKVAGNYLKKVWDLGNLHSNKEVVGL